MKRRIVVTSKHVRIEAVLTTGKGLYPLTGAEFSQARDELADALQSVAANVRWLGEPRHEVRVR